MFENHIREIEKLEFQIQFVALSGLSVLQLMLSNHANVKSLLAGLATGQVRNQELYERILYLLPLYEKQKELSYDGSVVTYLFCLVDRVPSLAFKASEHILRTKGLFWSRQLARAFSQAYLERKVVATMAFTSDEGEPIPYMLSERRVAEIRENLSYSLFKEAVKISPELLRRFQHDGDFRSVADSAGTSFRSPSAQCFPQGNVSPVQLLEIAIAS